MKKKASVSVINLLSEDVLCKILSHLEDIDLKSTLLVCKLFRSLSSSLLRKLTLKDSSLTYEDFQRLFKRFPHVEMISIQLPKLDDALMSISNSALNLETLQFIEHNDSVSYPEPQTIENMSTSRVVTSIKSLRMYIWWGVIPTPPNCQVIKFVQLFSSLTEFDSTRAWDDQGIHEITSRLPNLRNISCNNCLTDKVFDILFINCPKLETVKFQMCERITPEALYTFFCNNPQLISVDMPYLFYPPIHIVVKCMQVLQNLNHFSLKYDSVHDEVLKALAEVRPPLKSLEIKRCGSSVYTIVGLSKLLYACPDLEKLKICLPCLLPPHQEDCSAIDVDIEMSIVVKRLPKLKYIWVRSDVVCQATLFSLVQNCPLLETICLETYRNPRAKQVCDHQMARPTKKNYSIKSIQIEPDSNKWLLSMVEMYCPNLRKTKKET